MTSKPILLKIEYKTFMKHNTYLKGHRPFIVIFFFKFYTCFTYFGLIFSHLFYPYTQNLTMQQCVTVRPLIRTIILASLL